MASTWSPSYEEIWGDDAAPQRVSHVALAVTYDPDTRRRSALPSIGRGAENARRYD